MATSENGKSRLPNHKDYIMVYENYTDYNAESGTAKQRMYDLNHGNKLFYDATFVDGEVSHETFHPVITGLPSSCTGGADGDISWGECMNCVKTVCNSDPRCKNICKALNIAMGIRLLTGGLQPSCTSALAVGCVGVAIAY